MKTKLLILSVLLFGLLLGVVDSSAQTNEMQLRMNAPIEEIQLDSATILKVVSTISVKNKVPIGIELAKDEVLTKVNFSFEGTLAKALDHLVSIFPDYEWTIANSVVNILPRKEQENILGVVIEDYRTTAKQSYLLRLSILEAPEVVAKIEKMKLKAFTLEFGSLNARSVDDNFSLRMRKATVREILNEIAKRTYSKYWVIERGGENREEIRVYL